jgi:hypothetical protein
LALNDIILLIIGLQLCNFSPNDLEQQNLANQNEGTGPRKCKSFQDLVHNFKVQRKITRMTQFPPYALLFRPNDLQLPTFSPNGLQQQNQDNQNEGTGPRKCKAFQDSMHHMKVVRKITQMTQFPPYILLFRPNDL